MIFVSWNRYWEVESRHGVLFQKAVSKRGWVLSRKGGRTKRSGDCDVVLSGLVLEKAMRIVNSKAVMQPSMKPFWLYINVKWRTQSMSCFLNKAICVISLEIYNSHWYGKLLLFINNQITVRAVNKCIFLPIGAVPNNSEI